MLRHLTIAVAVVTALSVAAPPDEAAAQLRFAAGGGPSFPVSSLADGYNAGWHAQVSAGVSIPVIPISFRADGLYNRFPGETDGHLQVISGTVNGVFTIPSVLVTPYFIAGVGFYSNKISAGGLTGDSESSDIGVNIGGGVRIGLPFFSVFGEARLHNVFTEGDQVRFAPLTLGLHF